MNVQLHNVITDITGQTGMQIIRDIASGVTDPHALAAHRNYRCRASKEEIAASLTGNYRREYVFGLRQNLELYDSYQHQISSCDGEIESLLQNLAAQHDRPVTALPPARRRQRPKNEPRFEIRSPLHRLSVREPPQGVAADPGAGARAPRPPEPGPWSGMRRSRLDSTNRALLAFLKVVTHPSEPLLKMGGRRINANIRPSLQGLRLHLGGICSQSFLASTVSEVQEGKRARPIFIALRT